MYTYVKVSKNDQFILRIKKPFNKCNTVSFCTHRLKVEWEKVAKIRTNQMCALIRCFSYSHFSISFEHIDFTCQMKELFTHLLNPITTRLFFFSPILSSALCFYAFNEKWKLWMWLISICLLASQTNWKLKLNIPTDSKKIEKKKKNLKFVRIFWRSLQSKLFNLFAQFASCPIHKIVIFNRIVHILCPFVPVYIS